MDGVQQDLKSIGGYAKQQGNGVMQGLGWSRGKYVEWANLDHLGRRVMVEGGRRIPVASGTTRFAG
jgi:hypothetical protein